MVCYKYKKLLIIINKLINLDFIKKNKIMLLNYKYYKYNFFIRYINKIYYKLNIKLKNFFVYTLFQKKKKKKKKLYKYVKIKKHRRFAIIRKNIKKWWFYFKKRKRKPGRKKKIDFWLNKKIFKKTKYLIKFNNFIKKKQNYLLNYYNDKYFNKYYLEKKETYQNKYFLTSKDDEMYNIYFIDFLINYNNLFNTEKQFFYKFNVDFILDNFIYTNYTPINNYLIYYNKIFNNKNIKKINFYYPNKLINKLKIWL